MLVNSILKFIDVQFSDMLGGACWNTLRPHLSAFQKTNFSNGDLEKEVVLLVDELDALFGSGTSVLLNNISERLLNNFPRVQPTESNIDFVRVVYEIKTAYNAINVISKLERGSHLSILYESPAERRHILDLWAAKGVKANELNVAIAPYIELQSVRQLLTSSSSVSLRDFRFMNCDDVLKVNQDKHLILRGLLSALQKSVRQEQKTGLNIIGFCAGHLSSERKEKECMLLEDAWDDVVSSSEFPVSLICPYKDHAGFPESRLERNHKTGVCYA